MAEFDNRINKLREYMAEQKPEQYPLENNMLAQKDEYTKSLYLRMLCALIRYAGEPDEMQMLYIRRLIAGIDAEQEYPDYMKMALDLSTDDVDEFVSAFEDDELSYFFALDGMILLAVANGAEKQYDLLAELVELIDIDREELMSYGRNGTGLKQTESRDTGWKRDRCKRIGKSGGFFIPRNAVHVGPLPWRGH